MLGRFRGKNTDVRGTSPGRTTPTDPPAARKLSRGVEHLYGDDPVGPEGDRLERNRLANQLARTVVTISEQSRSAVVGLVGPWGSGKTSILADIERSLKEDSWNIGHHNPWAYSDYEGAVAGFFSALRDAVPDDVLGKDWRKAVGGWVSRLAPMGAVGGVVGVDATDGMNAVGALIAGDRSPMALRDEAVEGLISLEHPVLIVLDDLDRLEPRELLLTFKLVRLIGRLPNVYYLLAYDEATLIAVLQQTDIVGESPGRAQQYLEKMIQVRLEIPPLLEEQQLSLINDGIDDLCLRFDIQLPPDAIERLQHAWNACLAKYMTQPRAIKRLFTQVDALWPELNGEVDFTDFLLMTFIRTFEHDTFDLILANRDELLRNQWTTSSSVESNTEMWSKWQSLIEKTGARHPREMTTLLSVLFLPLKSAKERINYGTANLEDIRRRLGVGSNDYFDRYVQLGVPPGDLAESTVDEAVQLWRREERGPSLDELHSWMEKDAAKVIKKLERRIQSDTFPFAAMVAFLGCHYLASMGQTFGTLGLSPEWGILRLSEAAIRQLTSAQVSSIVRTLLNTDSGTALAADLVAHTERCTSEQKAGDGKLDWFDTVKLDVLNEVKERLGHSAARPTEEYPLMTRWMWCVYHLGGTEVIRKLNWEIIDSGTVPIESILGALVPLGKTTNGRSTWNSMGQLPEGSLDSLLGVEKLLDSLEAWPADRELLDEPTFGPPETEISFEDRKAYARSTVERIRRNRTSRPESENSLL